MTTRAAIQKVTILKESTKAFLAKHNLWFLQGLGQKLFSKYLIVTNTITGGILLAAGDYIQQRIECVNKATAAAASASHGKQNTLESHDYCAFLLDKPRLLRMTIIGFCLGNLSHFWYGLLDRKISGRNGSALFRKVFFDQAIGSPIFSLVFFIGIGMLEFKSIRDSFTEWRLKFPFLYLMDCLFWPPLQLFNFKYLPVKFQVLYVNFFTIIWDTFLSYCKHSYQVETSKPKSQVKSSCENVDSIPLLTPDSDDIISPDFSGEKLENEL